ncbi:hypothetical protein M0R72_07205 [Candidatus Pacearchaeota archaeon]|jgi:hypothetical protein|nr:hypothetical protein [Candidatus Pacearchaeota archaeon]
MTRAVATIGVFIGVVFMYAHSYAENQHTDMQNLIFLTEGILVLLTMLLASKAVEKC